MTMTPIDFSDRALRLARSVAEHGLDAYVGTRQAGLHWTNGAFMPWRGAVMVTRWGDIRTIYWKMDAERVRLEGAGGAIFVFEGAEFIPRIAGFLRECGVGGGKIGLDLTHPGAAQVAPGMLTAQEYLELQAALPEASFSNGVDVIDELMLYKDDPELERIRQATEVAEYGFKAGLNKVVVGATENEVAGEIEHELRRHGSTWAWAVTGGTEVGAGERTAFLGGVTQQATDRPIAADEFVILDIHPLVDLYMADLALPVFLGTPNNVQQRMIDSWHAAIETLFEEFRPGARVADCAIKAHSRFETAGFAGFGLPLFGHGLGTCARMRPFINPSSTDFVHEGMAVALGCHLYVPGQGGLRLEYPAHVTASGLQAFGTLPPRVVMKSDG